MRQRPRRTCDISEDPLNESLIQEDKIHPQQGKHDITKLLHHLIISRYGKVLTLFLSLVVLALFLIKVFDEISLLSESYNILDCPLQPPRGYPQEFPILEVLQTWSVTEPTPPAGTNPHERICVFDSSSTSTEKVQRQVENYKRAEVPFVVRNDPEVLQAVQKWSDTSYLSTRLKGRPFLATLSNTTLMTYYAMNPEYNIIPPDFQPPTRDAEMTFDEWQQRARQQPKEQEYAYLRLDACWKDRPCDSVGMEPVQFIYDDLSFFRPTTPSLYNINASSTRGIQCRFGSPGLTAELHFDNERNYIAMLHGNRRFLLAHPRNCPSMELHPQRHPLERHTQVDFRNLASVSRLSSTTNEVVLKAGDVLYLPTYWFHHIISLDMNYQCNTRSGYSVEYDQMIYDCGFFYDFPE